MWSSTRFTTMGSRPPRWDAMIFTSGYRLGMPARTRPMMAIVSSIGAPTDQTIRCWLIKAEIGAATRRMNIEHALSPIELGIDRMEELIGERTPQHRRRDRGAHHAQLVEAPPQLGECGLGVRQGKSREGAKAIGEAPRQGGVFVVGQARGFDGIRVALEVRRRRRDREDLQPDAGSIHQLEPFAKLVLRRSRAKPAMDRGAAVSQPDEKIEISLAPQMSMHVYSHRRTSIGRRAKPVRRPARAGRPRGRGSRGRRCRRPWPAGSGAGTTQRHRPS